LVLVGLAQAESIDGRVIRVRMPIEDVVVNYVETKGGMSILLRADKGAEFWGQKFYVGDGQTAVLMEVTEQGILFQGKPIVEHGSHFKKNADIQVLPGYKKASELKPGDVYVILPAIGFVLPKK
jgi:hypothetical protein